MTYDKDHDSFDEDYSDDDGGEDDNNDNEEFDDNNDGEGKSKAITDHVPPGHGLYYPEDNQYMDTVFDNDYYDKYHSSIPKEPAAIRNRNRIAGSPEKPDTSSMTKAEAVVALREFKVAHKAYTDAHKHPICQYLMA